MDLIYKWKLQRKEVAMHNQSQRIIVLFILIVILLCGCKQSPNTNAIVSKNDGSFDAGSVISASEAPTPAETQVVCTEDAFFSTDGTVEFKLHFNHSFSTVNMPIVEVTPHYLTAEDAKRVAYTLFGDADFYEAEPRFDPVYSKEEIQKKLTRWTPFGGDGGAVDSFIKEYTLLLESAPVENPHIPCQWDFQKSTYYYQSASDATNTDTSQDNDEIQATVKAGEIPYIYNVATRNKADFKLNYIYAKPYDGASPNSIDIRIFHSLLCQTFEPDEDTIAKIEKKVEKMLKQMDLGEWYIDQCYIEETANNGTPEYTVYVNAVPVFSGVAAFRRPQLGNLKSKEVYASNYYLTDIQFQFNAYGDLVYFSLDSPLDVKEIINDNVQVLSWEELINLAKNHFSLSDYYEYDYMGIIDTSTEELTCVVNISSIDYGLTRVKVPDTDDSYYYVPAIYFKGTIQFHGKESGNIYDVELDYGKELPLLILNGVDGSVINATNE